MSEAKGELEVLLKKGLRSQHHAAMVMLAAHS